MTQFIKFSLFVLFVVWCTHAPIPNHAGFGTVRGSTAAEAAEVKALADKAKGGRAVRRTVGLEAQGTRLKEQRSDFAYPILKGTNVKITNFNFTSASSLEMKIIQGGRK